MAATLPIPTAGKEVPRFGTRRANPGGRGHHRPWQDDPRLHSVAMVPYTREVETSLGSSGDQKLNSRFDARTPT